MIAQILWTMSVNSVSTKMISFINYITVILFEHQTKLKNNRSNAYFLNSYNQRDINAIINRNDKLTLTYLGAGNQKGCKKLVSFLQLNVVKF